MYGSSTRQSLSWSLSSLVPNCAEVAHEDLFVPMRTGMSGRRIRKRVGTSHSSPSMSATNSTGASTGVEGAAAPRSSSPGLRCSRGRRGPSPDAATGATPGDGPGRPCRPQSARGSDASCPSVVVTRPGCSFPAPFCRRPSPRGSSGVRLLPVPRYSSRLAALG
jgi:hypothetical protein